MGGKKSELQCTLIGLDRGSYVKEAMKLRRMDVSHFKV